MKNLKAIYDRVLKAEAARNLIAQEIVRLNDDDKFDEALKLQEKLDSANSDYDGAKRLYASMLQVDGEGAPGSQVNQRFVPAGGQAEPQEVTNLRATPEYANEWFAAFRKGVTPKNV